MPEDMHLSFIIRLNITFLQQAVCVEHKDVCWTERDLFLVGFHDQEPSHQHLWSPPQWWSLYGSWRWIKWVPLQTWHSSSCDQEYQGLSDISSDFVSYLHSLKITLHVCTVLEKISAQPHTLIIHAPTVTNPLPKETGAWIEFESQNWYISNAWAVRKSCPILNWNI